jgi:hypothetical protein
MRVRIDETGKECLSREIDPFRRRCKVCNAATIVHGQAFSRYEGTVLVEQ